MSIPRELIERFRRNVRCDSNGYPSVAGAAYEDCADQLEAYTKVEESRLAAITKLPLVERLAKRLAIELFDRNILTTAQEEILIHCEFVGIITEVLAAHWPQLSEEQVTIAFDSAVGAAWFCNHFFSVAQIRALTAALNALLRPGEQQKAAQPGESGKEPGK